MRDSNLIHPSSIRVWRGFRNASYTNDRSGFVDKLADIFIPLTCQAMMPIGLRSYIPTLVKSEIQGMPDEVALVGYSDQQTYYSASHDTVIGRAYGLLHNEVFNFSHEGNIPPSRSGFPKVYTTGPLKPSQSYYFSGKPINWSSTPVAVFVVPENNAEEQSQLIAALQNAIRKNLITEAILVQDSASFVLWLALKVVGNVPENIQALTSDKPGAIRSFSVPDKVMQMWTEREGGIPIKDNETLNLTLENSGLMRAAS